MAVEHLPHDLEVVGLIPPGNRLFLSFYRSNVSLNRSLADVPPYLFTFKNESIAKHAEIVFYPNHDYFVAETRYHAGKAGP